MITRILVPTDFSPAAGNALNFALGIAQKANAQVHLLHTSFIPVEDAYITASLFDEMLESIEAGSRDDFEKIRKEYYKDLSIPFISSTALGLVAETVFDYTQRHHIDLVVMGTTGASGVPHVLMGSNTTDVIKGSAVPVMAIPPQAVYHGFHHVVYATDYYGDEFPAVSRLTWFADMFGAQVHALNVQSDFEKFIKTESSFFERNRENLAIKKWEIKKVLGDNVTESIDRYVEENRADLLVMSRHKRSFFRRIFHRSLSTRMVHHSKVPLLVLGQEK